MIDYIQIEDQDSLETSIIKLKDNYNIRSCNLTEEITNIDKDTEEYKTKYTILKVLESVVSGLEDLILYKIDSVSGG